MSEDGTLSVEGLSFRTEGPVAIVTIDNASDQNRLTPRAITGLGHIAERLNGRDDLHVVVIRGTGDEYFSTGLLNPSLRSRMTKDEVISLVLQAAAVFDALEDVPQVVIGGLNGAVRAGGVELALACDIRIAAEHVRLAMPEAKWGGFPGAGGPLRLSRLIGRARALELICTGRDVGAAEMEKVGIIQQVAKAADFDQALWALVEAMASSGPLAVRGAKKIMKASEGPGFGEARRLSDDLRRRLEWSADVDEGMLAHREGRPPRFTGR